MITSHKSKEERQRETDAEIARRAGGRHIRSAGNPKTKEKEKKETDD